MNKKFPEQDKPYVSLSSDSGKIDKRGGDYPAVGFASGMFRIDLGHNCRVSLPLADAEAISELLFDAIEDYRSARLEHVLDEAFGNDSEKLLGLMKDFTVEYRTEQKSVEGE